MKQNLLKEIGNSGASIIYIMCDDPFFQAEDGIRDF